MHFRNIALYVTHKLCPLEIAIRMLSQLEIFFNFVEQNN